MVRHGQSHSRRRQRLQRELARDGQPVMFHELDDYGLWLVRQQQLTMSDLEDRET